MKWFQKIIFVFKDKQLRNKILFVLFIFVVFRILANIPIPGIDPENLRKFFAQNQFFGLLNLFTGGALSNLSIIMLGLGPYITGTIILQLLTMIFPQLEKMYKEEGQEGMRKFNQYGRLLTVPLAVLQGYAMINIFSRQQIIPSLSPASLLVSILSITAGAVFLMWLGELISEKGIGNGVSLLIFAGIVAQTPHQIRQMILGWDPSFLPSYIFFFIAAIFIITGVVLVNEGKRNIPISYAKRVRGTKVYGGVSTYLPININPAGVIPIIFALSILLFPQMFSNIFAGAQNQFLKNAVLSVNNFLGNQWVHGILYFTLVFFFTYFYTAVTFDPKSVATNLQKIGGFIPGLRPGSSTAFFLKKVLYKILFVGALFLGIIAVLPSIIEGVTSVKTFSFLIGGTSLLIMVSVVLDSLRQLQSQIEMRQYER